MDVLDWLEGRDPQHFQCDARWWQKQLADYPDDADFGLSQSPPQQLFNRPHR